MPITKEQLEFRKNHIGSSDMAAILGLDPWRSSYDVWLEKTGQLIDKEDNDGAKRAGSYFEKGVLRFAQDELGKIRRNQYRSAKDRGLQLGANIDALVVASGEPVEAKTAGLFGPITEVWGEPGTDEVPDRVIIQAHVHMICVEQDVCHVPAFLGGGRGFQMFVVKRDTDIADVICQTATTFWEKNVDGETAPDNSLPRAESIKRIRREPKTIVDISHDLVAPWLAAKEVVKEAKKRLAEVEIPLLTAIGDAEAGRTPLGMLTYYEQSRSGFNALGLQAERPELFKKFSTSTTFRVARYKVNK